MGRVHHNHVNACSGECLDPFLGSCAGADGCANAQSFLLIFAGLGIVPGFLNVLDGDHAAQLEAVIHDQHLFDAVLMQEANGFFLARALSNRDQLFLGGHGFGHGFLKTGFKAKIAAGYDSDQIPLVDNRYP